MNNFDKIIGYEPIKTELLRICDMIKNRDIYEKLGAKLPSGVLLYGDPGLGKTLMAKCFIKECDIRSFTVRKNKSANFVEYISETFKKAKEAAPSIIFLDDMDKFANEDDRHTDADEYVAVQAGIDDVKGHDVFVIATVNDMSKLPESLTRTGRFDKSILFYFPTFSDNLNIINHYLENKNVAQNVNVEDIAKMLRFGSCAALESILNEAAIIAAYKRKSQIEMEDIVKSVLEAEYDSIQDYSQIPVDQLKKVAYHEAGHLIMSEILCPESVGLASISKSPSGQKGGFVRLYKELPSKRHRALVSLSGKAAIELVYGSCADGCESDIHNAYRSIERCIFKGGYFGLGAVGDDHYCSSELSKSKIENLTRTELERCLFEAKEIIAKNRDTLDKIAAALLKKNTLLASDIKELMDRTKICC